MSIDVAAGPTPASGPAPSPATHAATPQQLRWLRDQVSSWQADGLLGDDQARTILARYRATRRVSLGRLLLVLGAVFVGIGLIWLVAANLDRLPPPTRFGAVVAIWLALVAVAHLGAERRLARGITRWSPVVEAGRLMAALAFGAVVFQAAQSLQVPAYEPSLVGFWSLGALLYAYAVRGPAPLAVGMVTGLVWVVWHSVETGPSPLAVLLVVVSVAVLAASASALHARFLPTGFPGFGAVWRDSGALLMLGVLFASAVPELVDDGLAPTPGLVVLLAVAVVAAAIAGLAGRGSSRWEPAAVVVVGLVATGLVLWEPSTTDPGSGSITAGDWAQSVLSVAVYVAVATWVAAVGVWRDDSRLVWLALASLVMFTTFQAFAVFARVVDGAWLFVALGAVLFGAGYGFDRGRRRLEAALTGPAREDGADR